MKMQTKRYPMVRAALFCFVALVAFAPLQAQDAERDRYADRPDALMSFANVTIYKDLFRNPPPFKGPGRDQPDPEVDRVKIGLIGPLTEEDYPIVPEGFLPGVTDEIKSTLGRHILNGALLAVEEANAQGGYRGKPFEIIRRTDLVQWGQTSNELAKFAYEDKVWAILGGLDSNHSHVLNRAALKAQVPLINPASTDPTLTEHMIPWLIRCVNDDRLASYELLNYIHRVKGLSRIALLRVNDRDGRVGVAEFIKGARRLGIPVKLELRFRNGDTDFSAQLKEIKTLDPEVLVLWANPREGAFIVRQAREMGLTQTIVGFDRMAHPIFLDLAGQSAEGLVVSSTFNPDLEDAHWIEFRSAFEKRFGEAPDAFAAHGYDGMSLIIHAIRSAGLNRIRIRDALYALETYAGVTGPILFDQTMNDISRPWLAQVSNGELEYFRPPDWPREQSFPVTLESETDP